MEDLTKEQFDKIVYWLQRNHIMTFAPHRLFVDFSRNFDPTNPDRIKKLAYLNNKPMDKKIKGYKAPYDLFGGAVKKDTVLIKEEGGYVICDSRNRHYALPAEWIETWEAVYEEKKRVYQE